METTIELYDSNTNVSVEVELDFDVAVEPTEYEGAYVFYQGGAVMEGVTITPFMFNGVPYTTITPDLVKYMQFNSNFLRDYPIDIEQVNNPSYTREVIGGVTRGDAIIDAYIDWVFENLVAPNVHIPVDYYPDARYC